MSLAIIGIGMIYGGSVANAATVGQQLTSPESGWIRIDDSDKSIKYSSEFYVYANDSLYEKSRHQVYHTTNTNTQYIKFSFYGSKLRLIDLTNQIRTKNSKISFDGGVTFESCSGYSESGTNMQSIFFEKTELDKKVHNVIIEIPYEGYEKAFCLDAIDIGDNGYLVNPNESITLDKSTMKLTEGDSQQLTATTTPAGAQVTWKSSDSSVATVDSTGKVTAAKEGTCTITATAADGLTATCVVTVISKGTAPNPQPIDTEYITNIAHAKGTNTNNPGGEVTIIFHGTADTILSIVKTADVKDVWIGDNFTYTLVITNTGTKTAKAVVVNDPAPNHIDFNVSGVTTTQGTVDSSSTSKNIIVNVGDILPGGTVTIKIPSTVIA
jgi:uncharacterized repeat protein (TIGR01451 family)